MKNSTYEPYRNAQYYMPDYDYGRLYKALAESGAEEYTDHLPREESYGDNQMNNGFDKV